MTAISSSQTERPAPAPLDRVGRVRLNNADFWLVLACRLSVFIVLGMLAALLIVLTKSAWPAMREFGPAFLVRSDWRPNELEQPKHDAAGKILFVDGEMVMETLAPTFGALPVIYGTAISSAIALAVAVPIGLGSALFLVRLAPKFLIAPVSFLIEFLAAIPSIAFGLWGLFVMAPFLQSTVEPAIKKSFGMIPGLRWLFFDGNRELPLVGRDMLCGGLILGVMILPIITAVSRDVLRAVPRTQIEGTLALGATWWQSCREMLRYSRSGLFGAVMLGLARAAGETMAITMVIGNNFQIKASPFAPAQTMSSLLANEFAEASGEMHRSALIEVALVLLLMSLLFNVVARYLVVGKSANTSSAH